MKKKNIVIFSTEESLISIPLVHHVISHKKYRDYEFDIFLTKKNLIRSIKVLLGVLLFLVSDKQLVNSSVLVMKAINKLFIL